MYSNGCGCGSGNGGLSGYDFGAGGTRSRYPDTGLGYVPWGTIVGGAFDLARSLIGGSDVTTCPGQISGARLRQILTAASAAQLEQLDALCQAVKARYPSSWSWYTGLAGLDLDRFAFNVQGGEDCQVTSTPGKALVAYLRELDAQTPGTVSTNVMVEDPFFPSGSDYAPVLEPGPVLIADTTPPDAGPSLWDQIREAAEAAARAAAGAGARAAAGAAYTSLPSSSQEELDRYAAQAYAQQTQASLASKLPLILGAGLLVGLVLMTARK